AYSATKGAMNALTRSMAVGYAQRRIRVNAISSGLIESGESIAKLLADPATRDWLERSIPLPYFGVPEDIAWGCVYLESDESRYFTGAVLPIDGGYLACPACLRRSCERPPATEPEGRSRPSAPHSPEPAPTPRETSLSRHGLLIDCLDPTSFRT